MKAKKKVTDLEESLDQWIGVAELYWEEVAALRNEIANLSASLAQAREWSRSRIAGLQEQTGKMRAMIKKMQPMSTFNAILNASAEAYASQACDLANENQRLKQEIELLLKQRGSEKRQSLPVTQSRVNDGRLRSFGGCSGV